MHRQGLASVVVVAILCAGGTCLSACAVAAYPSGAYVDYGYPPAEFVATTQPVYFEGHAAYWYGGRWCYRDGARWGYYEREPPALASRRMQFTASARVNYGRPSTRVVARPARR